jgi:hypothetical protein
MANPFNSPQLFRMPQLPELYSALVGSPLVESLNLTQQNQFDNSYQLSNYWNEGLKVNGGVDYDKQDPPTQFKDPASEMYNEFSGTYFL